MDQPRKKTDPFTVFLSVASIALAALVLLLAKQNRDLKGQLAAAATHPDEIKTGETLPPLTTVTDSGEQVPLQTPDATNVVLVFSSTCPACEQALPIWKELIEAGIGSGVNVIGVQTDRFKKPGDPPLALALPLPFPVVGITRLPGEAMERIPFIPAAIVTDSARVVRHVWFGVPDDARKSELKRVLAGS